MADSDLRSLVRAAREGDPQARGRLLSAQLRAGTLTAPLGGLRPEGGRVFRLAEGVACGHCEGTGCAGDRDPRGNCACCQACHTGLVKPDPQAVLRLRAYLGCEWARERLGERAPLPCYGVHIGHSQRCERCDAATWTKVLSKLASPMPKVLGEGPCTECDEIGYVMRSGRRDACKCDAGRVSWEVNYSRWLLVAVGAGVARAVLRGYECPCASADEHGCWDCQNTGYDNAEGNASAPVVEAAEEWVRCPCPEHTEAWWNAYQSAGGELRTEWLPGPRTSAAGVVLRASRLLGEAQTGEAAREAARRVVEG